MNGGIVRYILGKVLIVEGAVLLLPCLVGLLYREGAALSYLITAALCAFVGFLASFRKPKDHVFYLKEGCLSTALSWIALSMFGSFPFLFSGEITSFTDAVFETVSGFTTTGATILPDVEALSHASLFWRSFTHWIGGMGILVFMMAIIPLTGGSNINLMRAESPGPSVGKLVPRIKTTAAILYRIYIGMTLIEFVLLLIARMPVFDAITLTFGTAGTGGFGIKNDSIASYNDACQWIITIFMFLFGVNFNAFFFLIMRQFRRAFQMEEVRRYFEVVLASTLLIAANIYHLYGSVYESLRLAAFQVSSIITTTGYSTINFDHWPSFSKYILILLMFVGACAGSTGGGVKVSRFIILIKSLFKEILIYIHPKSVKRIKMDGQPIEHETVRATNVYMVTFLLIFILSGLIVSLEGADLVTTFTAVAATFNNIGPGFAGVDPTKNFGFFHAWTKWVLIFDMLAGRLELFPILILFHPSVWAEAFDQWRRKRSHT